MIAEAPEIAAIKRNRGLGDVTPITEHDLWTHTNHTRNWPSISSAQRGATERTPSISSFERATVSSALLSRPWKSAARSVIASKPRRCAPRPYRHIPALDRAIAANSHYGGVEGQAIVFHLDELRNDATGAHRRIEEAAAALDAGKQSPSPDKTATPPAPKTPTYRKAPSPSM